MSNHYVKHSIFTFILITLNCYAFAQTTYISDELYVMLRSGAGEQFRILKSLKSSTTVTRIEASEEGNWTLIKLEDGTEGWVPSQYLIDEPTAELKLNETVQKSSQLQQEKLALTEQNAELSNQVKQLTSQLQQTTAVSAQSETELKKIKAISSNAIELDRRHQELLEKHQLMQTERDMLFAENENLKNDQRMSFMFLGAAILVAGMILVFIIQAIKPKNRYSEWK